MYRPNSAGVLFVALDEEGNLQHKIQEANCSLAFCMLLPA